MEDQDLGAVVTETGADVVVTSLSSPHVPTAYQRLLFRLRCVALVTISPDGHYAEVYDRKVIREVASEQLVQVIRTITQQRDVPGVGDKLV